MIIKGDDAVTIRQITLSVDDRDRWSAENNDRTVDKAADDAA